MLLSVDWLMCGCWLSQTGTARLQLQHKGDDNHTYTDLANILPCAGILGLPIISWLLDKKVLPVRVTTNTVHCL